MQLLIALLLGAVVLAAAAIHFFKVFREMNDPAGMPGPTQIPYIGRIHDLPIDHMWLKFKEWGDKHATGGLYRTEMLGAKFVIITDERVAEDLLVKRAKFNSDRPQIRSLFDSKSGGEYLPLMGRNRKPPALPLTLTYTTSSNITPFALLDSSPLQATTNTPTPEYWSRQRRLTHAYITEATNARYHGIMYFESKRWLARLATDPSNFQASLEDMASKVMCQLTWDDPSLSSYCTKSAWGLLRQMSPAGPITNVLTPLWHLPWLLNPWKRAERKRHDDQQAWWMNQFARCRAKTAKGEMRPCWTRQFQERTALKTTISGDHEASSVIGMLALVGIFTVAGPLSYWLVAMVHHPEWQAAVQREVDEVCEGRLPTLEDAPRLPVLRACIKETMRWRPNVPTGGFLSPFFCFGGITDIVSQAWRTKRKSTTFITGTSSPRGPASSLSTGTFSFLLLPFSLFLTNGIIARAFLRNPEKYPDPSSFRPERWLEPGWPTFQAPLSQFPTIKGMSSFGWGQRQCLGMNLTQDELLIACGSLAWGFNLKHKVDPITGETYPVPTDKSNSLLIIKPDPFKMAFEPRSKERRAETLRIWEEADALDRRTRMEFLTKAREDRQASMSEKIPVPVACTGVSPMIPLKDEVVVEVSSVC